MWLRKLLDNVEPHFTPGGKYEGWYALKDKQAAWEKRKVKKLRKKTYVLKD